MLEPTKAGEGVQGAGGHPGLEVLGVSKSFGGLQALQSVTLAAADGEITALIGPNGAGKTTLINAISGVVRPDAGSVWLDGHSLNARRPAWRARFGVLRTYQRVRVFPQLTVLENAMAACWARSSITHRKSSRDEALAKLEHFKLAAYATRYPQGLTFSDLRRLEIVRCLLARPRLLMLDEPAAGMNPDEAQGFVRDIGELQRNEGLTILLVEHNMNVIMSLAHTIHVLNFGNVIATGSPGDIRRDPAVIEAYLGADA